MRKSNTTKPKTYSTGYAGLYKKFYGRQHQDVIECPYIDGVTDDKGRTVIRPLTDEEKIWLARANLAIAKGSSADMRRLGMSQESRRETWKDAKRRSRDMMSSCAGLRVDDDPSVHRFSSTDEFLSSVDNRARVIGDEALVDVLAYKRDLESFEAGISPKPRRSKYIANIKDRRTTRLKKVS